MRHTDSAQRTRRLGVNVAATAAAHVVSFAVPLVTIPLTVGYLGDARFGVWTTLTATLGWFGILDLGLANSMRNHLSVAFARGDAAAARDAVSTVFFSFLGLALVAALLLLGVGSAIDLPKLFNARSLVAPGEIETAVAIILGTLLARLPLTTVSVVYSAKQEHYVGSAWDAAGAVASLAATYAATRSHGGLVALAISAGVVPLIFGVVGALYLFVWREPRLRPLPDAFHLGVLRGMLGLASHFLTVQAAALIVYQTDSFVIARILGPLEVTQYSIAYRLCWVPVALQAMVLNPLWPAYSEAVERRDYEWVRSHLLRTVWLSVAAGLTFLGGICLLGARVIAIWSGAGVIPTKSLLALLGAWTALFLWQSCFVTFLNAIGSIRIQSRLAVVSAPVNVLLCVLGARYLGVAGVAAANVATMCVGALQAPIEARVRLRELRAQEGR